MSDAAAGISNAEVCWLPTCKKSYEEYKVVFPLTSPLSFAWYLSFETPGQGNLSGRVTLYVLGMIGFIVACPFRVARLTGRLIICTVLLIAAVLYPCNKESWSRLADRTVRLLVTTLKIVTCCIGIICPIAAYALERQIDRLMPEGDETYYVCFTEEAIEKMTGGSVGKAFATLGLSEDATWEDVRKAYKKLAFDLHPDKNPNDPVAAEKFKEMGNAYARLDAHFHPPQEATATPETEYSPSTTEYSPSTTEYSPSTTEYSPSAPENNVSVPEANASKPVKQSIFALD